MKSEREKKSKSSGCQVKPLMWFASMGLVKTVTQQCWGSVSGGCGGSSFSSCMPDKDSSDLSGMVTALRPSSIAWRILAVFCVTYPVDNWFLLWCCICCWLNLCLAKDEAASRAQKGFVTPPTVSIKLIFSSAGLLSQALIMPTTPALSNWSGGCPWGLLGSAWSGVLSEVRGYWGMRLHWS